MARVVVVGGGLAGLASAARLAKLGHQVTLVERLPVLGGALAPVQSDGFTWDAGATSTLLPAVLRDLFRKSGRPLERELTLEPQEVIREHRFEDETVVALPGGSRAAQLRAVGTLGSDLGEQWCDYVAGFADDWDLARRHYLERPWRAELTDPAVSKRLLTRDSLARRIKRSFRDPRLRLMASWPHTYAGQDPRDLPAWWGMSAYLEQNFGVWRIAGGMHRVVEALGRRLETRGVTVQTETTVTDLVVREGRVVAVSTTTGELDADAVVCAIDPRAIPTLAAYVRRTMPALPPVVCHLGLKGDLPPMAAETVFHGDPTLTLRTTGQAPEGHQAWTLHGRGLLAEDIVASLARTGIDVRSQVVARVDRSPREQVEHWNGSPWGVRWQGRATMRERLDTVTPVPGVYAAGASATPGAGVPFTGLSAALVAQEIGPA